MITIDRYGSRYTEGGKCPACSNEIDTGGRLKRQKRKYFFLKCAKCKYTIHATVHYEKKVKYLKKQSDKDLYTGR